MIATMQHHYISDDSEEDCQLNKAITGSREGFVLEDCKSEHKVIHRHDGLELSTAFPPRIFREQKKKAVANSP